MRKKLKLFIIYFPVILIACQIAANTVYFVSKETYFAYGFYLNHFFGTNMLFAMFLVGFTFMFRFCAVSRWAAMAELLFALYYLIIQQDDVYNIVFQITAGSVAMILTAVHYIKKFPFCKLSLLVSFISSLMSTGSCEQAFRHWDKKIENKLEQTYLNQQPNDY